MSVELSVGAELDIGDVSDDRKNAKARALLEWQTPRELKIPISIDGVPNNSQSFDALDGPAQNRQWSIKRFVLDQANPVAAAAVANVSVFIFGDSGSFLGSSQLTLISANQLIWRCTAAESVPFRVTFGRAEAQIAGGEKLIVVVRNASGSTLSFQGQCQVIDEPLYNARDPYL